MLDALVALSLLSPFLSPPDPFAEANNLADSGHYDQAAASADRALADELRIRPPDEAALYYGRHLYFMMLANRRRSVDGDLRRLLAGGPASFHQSLAAAEALQLLDRSKESVSWATKAAELEPNNSRALTTFARALLAVGEPEEAIARLRRAIALNPREPSLQIELAKILEILGRWDEARQARAVAGATLPLDVNAAIQSAYSRAGADDPSGFIQQSEEIVRSHPQDGIARHHLAVALWNVGRTQEACLLLDQALAFIESTGRKGGREWAHTQAWRLMCNRKTSNAADWLRTAASVRKALPRCSLQWALSSFREVEFMAESGMALEAARAARARVKECSGSADFVQAKLQTALAVASSAAGSRDAAIEAAVKTLQLLNGRFPAEQWECHDLTDMVESIGKVLDKFQEDKLADAAFALLEKWLPCTPLGRWKSQHYDALIGHAIKRGDCAAAERYYALALSREQPGYDENSSFLQATAEKLKSCSRTR